MKIGDIEMPNVIVENGEFKYPTQMIRPTRSWVAYNKTLCKLVDMYKFFWNYEINPANIELHVLIDLIIKKLGCNRQKAKDFALVLSIICMGLLFKKK